ncbi:hypothetical protein RM572_07615 [Streptomyces sp. DSM 42041]|uniref:Nudix hydrolase domain-containing protein n=1 Tax=Streptomyces hazeniae TaxID=3075538 RepID=A0ABU2NRL4_9ACTN|nr:hypothetical protein [Streptomyces sp. DSM 42041]MDT0378647.1 hypothetical protein [Streptomyces sp. DSM 42041]
MGAVDLTNAVVGAVVGMLAAALFQQPLQDAVFSLRKRASRTLHALRAEERSVPVWNTFSLGPLHTSGLIVEGDGTTPIAPESVFVQVLDDEVRLPDEMARWRDEIEEDNHRRRAAGDTSTWNGDRYAVEAVSVSRSALDENPEVHIRLRPTDYYTYLAAQQLDRPLASGGTPRSRYLDPDRPLEAPAFLQCSLGANVAVVTADDLLVVTRRSTETRMAPGLWNVSVNEGLSRHIDSAGRRAPDLHALARRGMQEEMALEPHEYELTLLAVALDVQKRHWGLHFYAKLSTLTGSALEARISRGVADRWEHSTVDFVRFRPADVTRYVLRPDRVHRWAPLAPSLFHLALVHVHSRTPVERAEAQVIRRL